MRCPFSVTGDNLYFKPHFRAQQCNVGLTWTFWKADTVAIHSGNRLQGLWLGPSVRETIRSLERKYERRATTVNGWLRSHRDSSNGRNERVL